MIGKLTGIIDNISDNKIILDVNGVGYVVTCSACTLRDIGRAGDNASLLIDTIVREDAISLFGFASRSEQEWFRLLTTVQGVGSKVAIAILGTVSPDRLAAAIAAQEKSVLTAADGVGAKLALRIITELKDKVSAFAGNGAKTVNTVSSGMHQGISSEAVSALCNLGYKRADAFSVVSAITAANQDIALKDLIRLSLKELAL
ncbi:MAG: Holliday junction branch migration protein RuvA [Alphaproteobacteria bacterium]|nr:Holliday junction branch migration protein RuvA [Alphaproteobacteria bacterium]